MTTTRTKMALLLALAGLAVALIAASTGLGTARAEPKRNTWEQLVYEIQRAQTIWIGGHQWADGDMVEFRLQIDRKGRQATYDNSFARWYWDGRTTLHQATLGRATDITGETADALARSAFNELLAGFPRSQAHRPGADELARVGIRPPDIQTGREWWAVSFGTSGIPTTYLFLRRLQDEEQPRDLGPSRAQMTGQTVTVSLIQSYGAHGKLRPTNPPNLKAAWAATVLLNVPLEDVGPLYPKTLKLPPSLGHRPVGWKTTPGFWRWPIWMREAYVERHGGPPADAAPDLGDANPGVVPLGTEGAYALCTKTRRVRFVAGSRIQSGPQEGHKLGVVCQ